MRPIEMLDPTYTEKKATGICTTCGEKALFFKDNLSKEEHAISGMCQICQDLTFVESENYADYD